MSDRPDVKLRPGADDPITTHVELTTVEHLGESCHHGKVLYRIDGQLWHVMSVTRASAPGPLRPAAPAAEGKRVRKTTVHPPADPTAAIAWALLQKPAGWEIGEWLARLMPEGVWSDIEPEALADQIVDAAVRARGDEPPS